MADPGIRDAATPVVSAFYDRFPFPGDPLQDGPPPGYNWRWCHQSVLAAVHGVVPAGSERPRILDAGCGTGVSTDYLCHLNPGADVLGDRHQRRGPGGGRSVCSAPELPPR